MNTVAKSSSEAEYISMSNSSNKAIWLKLLISEIKNQNIKLLKPIYSYCDNSAAVMLAYNPVYHERTKHADVVYHGLRESVNDQKIQVKQISTKGVITYILIKFNACDYFEKFKKLMGIYNQGKC